MGNLAQTLVFYQKTTPISAFNCQTCKYWRAGVYNWSTKKTTPASCAYVASPIYPQGLCTLFTHRSSPLPSLPALPLALIPKVFFASAEEQESMSDEVQANTLPIGTKMVAEEEIGSVTTTAAEVEKF